MKVKSESEVTSRVQLFTTPWTAAYQAPLSMGFWGKSTGVGCHCLLRPYCYCDAIVQQHILPLVSTRNRNTTLVVSHRLLGVCATSPRLIFTLYLQFSSVQSLSHVQLFVTPWAAARQASLSITNSQSPPKPMSIDSVIPSTHLILCRPVLFLPSIFPSFRVFSDESALCIR